MAEKTSDKIKYRILRFLDVTGFTVFDPIVRLCFGEEPKKQIESIFKFLLIPIAFITFCVWIWATVAPKHKTKSGEVPTPDIVRQSAYINHQFAHREDAKAADFVLEGTAREDELIKVEQLIEENSVLLEERQAELALQEAAYAAQLELRLAPLQRQLDEVKIENKSALAEAKAAVVTAAENIEAGNGSTDALVVAIRNESAVKDTGRAAETIIKDKVDAIRSEKYKPMEDARLAVNAVADEVQFLKKRVDFLTSANRSMKVLEAEEKLAGYSTKLTDAESAKVAALAAKSYVRTEDSIERLEGQKYAKAMTVYLQIKRSLFTVFIGFITAAIIAIPVGILCGLSRIAMACLTPIISIFKPVSPVVWLLIFQIVVGAFFPDPESHPFFLFFNSLPLIGSLGINPE